MKEIDLIKELKESVVEMIEESLNNKVVADLNNISKNPGHYIILSDKPVPEIACKNPNFKIGDLYCWYNGTSGKIRSRIKSHLHRKDINAQASSSSGIAVETIKVDDLPEGSNLAYFKKANADGSLRFLNGIQYSYDANFYVATIDAEYLDCVIEKMFRDVYGAPPLCQYDKR